jgi:DNA primase
MPGRIPKSFIDDLMLRVDIADVIDARVPLKKAGKDFKACCPFHEEKTPSFTVSPAKQFYHCFGCGAHGTAIGFLMDYEHMEFIEAVEDLAAHAGMEVPREADADSGKSQAGTALIGVLQEATRYYRQQLREHPQSQYAIEYLKGRGISGDIAQAFGLGYAPDGWDNLVQALGKDATSREQLVAAGLAVKKENGGCYDRFRNRVMFPIHDYRGRIVGFGGRVIGNDEPKYLNSPETALFHKGREVYGLYRARDSIKQANRVIVVEGYMDVVALAQFGVDNAVATLGTATTRDHIERLFRFAPEIIFCFDGDRAGRDAAWRALENALPAVRDGRQLSFLLMPEGDDPDSLVRKIGRDGFVEYMTQARPLPDFLFEYLARQVDLGRLDGRARLVELAKPLLLRIPAGVFREMMMERLAELSQLGSQKLAATMDNTRNSTNYRPVSSGAVPKDPPSAIRLAIGMLVQHPKLAAIAPAPDLFATLDQPGVALLRALLEMLRGRTGLNTAAVIEHFRESEHRTHLAKLAAWDHPAFAHDVESGFAGLMEQLRRAAVKSSAERLLQKQRLSGLDAGEKAELARLLGQRETAAKPATH